MKIGILGGSFNPPHQGHLYISNLAVKKLGLHQIWWIPTPVNPLKSTTTNNNFKDRINQCRLLTQQSPKIRVKFENEVYSHKLLDKLKKRNKTVRFFWIMGADNVSTLHLWKKYKNFIATANLVIFSREKFLKKIQYSKSWKFVTLSNYQIIRNKNYNISSTRLRNKN